ncbi:DUF927 domain-containing protein [Pseudodonghicola sp.]|jgi:putative DNA primase/helicase|uniref:DUF927 domain-containing protein n=1 Tax=Pseudodonghicola sp. TaxID=1969463 RepID=UPI003A97DB89
MTQTPSPNLATTGTPQTSELSTADRFLCDLGAKLPRPYLLAHRKIHISDRHGNPGMAVCSPLRVTALVRDPDGHGWARLVEVLTPDQRVIECVLPHAEIEAKPLDAIARLADCGMQIHGQRDDLITFLKSWTPSCYALRLDQAGWNRDCTAFALADGRIIAPTSTNETMIYTGAVNRFSTGSFESWQSGIAALCLGNPFLIFGISLALSGPLLALTNRTGGIFHLHGATSIGKTKILQAALSVWPSASKEFSWTSTSSGLAGLLVEANDTFLGLDELPREPHAGFGDDIYSAANGAGKNRATVTGKAQARQQWRVSILSTGETPVRKVLRDQGHSLRGGQGVRMIDIPVTGMTHGAFDDLHGFPSSKDFARELECIAPRDSGHAGPIFVRNLIVADRTGTIRTITENTHRTELAKLMNRLDLDAGTAGNEILRVLDRFALIATAGEFARKLQITGWPSGAASDAVARVAAAWYEHRGADTSTDQTAAVEITRDYLQRFGDSRFAILRNGDQNNLEAPAARSHEAAGYRDEDYFYILKPSFDEIHRGYDTRRAGEHLQAAGYLEPGGERNSLQYRLPGFGKQRPRVYRIRADILGA